MKTKTIILSILSALLFNTNGFSQNFEWAKAFGGLGADKGNAVTTDADGNIYSTGTFEETVDMDPGPGVFNLTSNGESDIFVQKLNANGDLIWAVSFGSVYADEGMDLVIDHAGNIYTVGSYADIIDFDPSTSNTSISIASGDDIFIHKLDASGNFIWAKGIGGTGIDFASAVAIDLTGNIYVSGIFEDTVKFDTLNQASLLGATGLDAFVLKLNLNGDYIWVKDIIPGFIDVYVQDLIVNNAGEICAVGSSDGPNIFIHKLDVNGNLLFAKTIGGSYYDYGMGIVNDIQDNLYITGFYQDTVDFDPGNGIAKLISTGDYDSYILKLDMNGNYLWAKSFGGPNDDMARAITLDKDKNVYITGRFRDVADFNPSSSIDNLTSFGSYDVFILKLDSNGMFIWAKSLGGPGSDNSNEIITDSLNNVMLIGEYRSSAILDPINASFTSTAMGSSDIFILKLSQDLSTNSHINTLPYIQFYPNPCKNYFMLESALRIKEIEITDMAGRILVKHTNLFSKGINLSTENLYPGAYSLSILFENDRYQKIKIIKN